MRTLGIVAEFNPFHNGHQYLVDALRDKTGATHIIAVMSGSFVQRGEVAVFDKWSRARAAVLGGVDLVLELPVSSALKSAEGFAQDAVFLLHSLGVVDFLGFGSECGKPAPLASAAQALIDHDRAIHTHIKTSAQKNTSYPAARAAAAAQLCSVPADLLSRPNNLLGVEYIKALLRLKSSMQPVTLSRVGSGHHDTASTGSFASATAIRQLLLSGDLQQALSYVPASAAPLYTAQTPRAMASLDPSLSLLLRRMPEEEYFRYPDLSNGLQARIRRAAETNATFSAIADAAKTKCYTHSRIRRSLCHILLGIHTEDLALPPQYFRVLAFNERGAQLIKKARQRAEAVSFLPILTRLATDRKSLSPMAQSQLQIDCRATDLAALCDAKKEAGQDYTTSPAFIR